MTELVKTEKLDALLSKDSVKKRLFDILGKNAETFATSVLQTVKSNDLLMDAEPQSILGAAMTAATLGLPINNSIGFAYIIPYNLKQKDGTFVQKAQFQLGYKGFIQLAMRSGQFKTMNVTEVKQGEIGFVDFLTGEIDWTWLPRDKKRSGLPTIGYVAYFRLLNGFEKSLYMTNDELQAHGKKFSKTFAKGFGLWKDDFDSMAKKTVLKLLISKYAPLSVEMQTSVITDQAIIEDIDNLNNVEYPDNQNPVVDPEAERLVMLIETAKTQEELDWVKGLSEVGEEHLDLIKKKQKELNEKSKK